VGMGCTRGLCVCVQAGAEFCDVLRPPAKRLCGKCSDTKKRGEEKKKKKNSLTGA
jgi:hypothetical protein